MYIHDFQIAFEDILGRLYTNWPVLHNSSFFFMYNMYTIFLSMRCIHFRHYSSLHISSIMICYLYHYFSTSIERLSTSHVCPRLRAATCRNQALSGGGRIYIYIYISITYHIHLSLSSQLQCNRKYVPPYRPPLPPNRPPLPPNRPPLPPYRPPKSPLRVGPSCESSASGDAWR